MEPRRGDHPAARFVNGALGPLMPVAVHSCARSSKLNSVAAPILALFGRTISTGSLRLAADGPGPGPISRTTRLLGAPLAENKPRDHAAVECGHRGRGYRPRGSAGLGLSHLRGFPPRHLTTPQQRLAWPANHPEPIAVVRHQAGSLSALCTARCTARGNGHGC